MSTMTRDEIMNVAIHFIREGGEQARRDAKADATHVASMLLSAQESVRGREIADGDLEILVDALEEVADWNAEQLAVAS